MAAKILRCAVFTVLFTFFAMLGVGIAVKDRLSLSAVFLAATALLLSLAAACLIAKETASKILSPFSRLDITDPKALDGIPELEPVARNLREQNRIFRKKAEELQLRQTEFAAITDNMNEGMLVIGSEAELLSYNKSAEEMLGLPLFEKKPKNITELALPPTVRRAIADALSGKRAVESIRRDGKYYSVLVSPVVQDKSVEGAVAVILDETEKEAREALRQQFTSNISHELKTPLTSISGFAELIMEGLAEGEEKRFAGNIYHEAQRLILLVGDIIKLTRLDGGEIEFDKEPIDLFQLCKTVADRLSNIAEAAHVSLSVRQALEARSDVRGNATLLEEMIYNMLDNSIKYNRPGGMAELSVEYLPDAGSGRVIVRCRDNGIGIPEGQRERVFERFYRVDKSRSKAIGGTGLGLSIVKHGAACHGAEIMLKSRENEGTEIALSFPAYSAGKEQPAVQKEAPIRS